jgi:hypothetical protein
MNNQTKLFFIKLIHTIIWLFFVVIIFYIVYSGIFNDITIYTWISVSFVILEGIILVIFKYYCPLTIIARQYSKLEKDNFDIFLPNWLAKHNKIIFTSIYAAGLLLVIARVTKLL